MTEITAQVLPIGDLHESPWNPRKHFGQAALEELAESIRKVGILAPVMVRPRDAGGYEIASGHRRTRAAALAALTEIPAIIRPMGDQEFLEILTIENLQRQDVHPLDEGEGYRTLMRQTGWDADTVAAKVGKSRSYVYQRLKLAELIEPARKAFLEDKITAGHAILIARLPASAQREALKACFLDRYGYERHGNDEEPASVRDLARWIEQEIHLDLHAASFKKDDATLVPQAGPCTSCPKRTGFAPDLFPEVVKKDTCTDRSCFKAKTQAFTERAMAEAKESGEELLQLSAGYGNRVKPGVIRYGDWNEAKPKSCPHVKRGIVLTDEQGTPGRILTVCAEPSCKKHRGYVRSAADMAREERWRRDRQREQEKRSRETDRRRRILMAIRENIRTKQGRPDEFTRADWELIAMEFFIDVCSDLRKPVMKMEGWLDGKGAGAYYDHEKTAAKLIPAFSDVDLARFLVTLSLMKSSEFPAYGGGRPVDRLLAAAKRWGVDVAKLDAQLKAEAAERLKKKAKKAAAQIAKKKATKVKGNGKTAAPAKTWDEPMCIECGCIELTPCQTEAGDPCAWSAFDTATMIGRASWTMVSSSVMLTPYFRAGVCSACEPDKARAKRILRDWIKGGDGPGAATKPAKAGARSVQTSATVAA